MVPTATHFLDPPFLAIPAAEPRSALRNLVFVVPPLVSFRSVSGHRSSRRGSSPTTSGAGSAAARWQQSEPDLHQAVGSTRRGLQPQHGAGCSSPPGLTKSSPRRVHVPLFFARRHQERAAPRYMLPRCSAEQRRSRAAAGRMEGASHTSPASRTGYAATHQCSLMAPTE